jgi:two-component sensor histidine kinase
LKFRTKLIITFFLFVALLGIVVIAFIRGVLSKELTTELQKRGIGIAKHFTAMATDHVLTENIFSLKMLSVDYKDAEENVEYVFIMDKDGKILAHTFVDGFPVELRTANAIRPEQEFNVQILKADNKRIFDIAVPVLSGAAGIVRIGISAEPIREEVARLTTLTVWIIFSILLFGIIVAISLTIALTKPITELEKAAQAIGEGDLEHRVNVKTSDEIGHLSETFNMMTENLQKTTGELKQSIHEKEILLKEIHHRVKNNMAIVSSLLQLQARNSNDENVNRLFQDSQSRISSMALVHEKLYQTTDITNINLREYVEEFVRHIMSSYGKKEGDIGLLLSINDIKLTIDTMIPIGLILNELVTNSLKYAFEGVERPEISISFDAHDGQATLIYSDNGSGMPEHIDFQDSKTLGLQLVNMLTVQLMGTVQLERNDGTRFTIKFDLVTQD